MIAVHAMLILDMADKRFDGDAALRDATASTTSRQEQACKRLTSENGADPRGVAS